MKKFLTIATLITAVLFIGAACSSSEDAATTTTKADAASSAPTTVAADSGSDRALGIFKVVNGVKTPLTDSQVNKQKTLNEISGSTSYKVDIRVNYNATADVVAIDVFINNFKISAVDSSDVLSPTSNFCNFARLSY